MVSGLREQASAAVDLLFGAWLEPSTVPEPFWNGGIMQRFVSLLPFVVLCLFNSAVFAAEPAGFFGGSSLTNPNISLVLNTFGYSSNLDEEELQGRGIPGFTTSGLEQRRGFNLAEAELVIFAPVDPYFNLYATMPVSEEGAELEEAYVITTALPEGFQLKGGKFKSNFSRLDSQHPHAWDFADISLPYRAFLGEEGLGGETGLQLTWLPALPIYLQFGAEVLQGNNELLFGEEAASGPHAYTFFLKGSFEPTGNSTLHAGPYVLVGQTRTSAVVEGSELDGESVLYGFEAVWKWQPAPRRGLALQAEYLYLKQDGDLTDQESSAVAALERRQDGLYVQALVRFDRWRVGARYDVLEPFADTFEVDGEPQNLGGTPWRATASLEFNPSEFTRIRLQYTNDHSARDGQSNNEWFLQFIFGIGAHAGHAF